MQRSQLNKNDKRGISVPTAISFAQTTQSDPNCCQQQHKDRVTVPNSTYVVISVTHSKNMWMVAVVPSNLDTIRLAALDLTLHNSEE